jgi:hypothetical protein
MPAAAETQFQRHIQSGAIHPGLTATDYFHLIVPAPRFSRFCGQRSPSASQADGAPET